MVKKLYFFHDCLVVLKHYQKYQQKPPEIKRTICRGKTLKILLLLGHLHYLHCKVHILCITFLTFHCLAAGAALISSTSTSYSVVCVFASLLYLLTIVLLLTTKRPSLLCLRSSLVCCLALVARRGWQNWWVFILTASETIPIVHHQSSTFHIPVGVNSLCICSVFTAHGSDGSIVFSIVKFFSLTTITHEPLHLDWWNFARTCTLTTSAYWISGS